MITIGIDPHKGSHTVTAVDGSEVVVGEVRVEANRHQRARLADRVVTKGLGDSQHDALALVEAFERFWQVRFPEAQRARWIDNDPEALQAMWTQVLAEGPVATALTEWTVPCLIVMGAGDADLLEQARRAAAEIPRGELLLLERADHYAAHVSADDALIEAVRRTLRA